VTLLVAGICIATKSTTGVVAVAVLRAVAVCYVPHAQHRWLREAAWAGQLGIIALDAVALWNVILLH
jgi:hypothetical protein